jgi:hypothetical protein
MIKLVKKKEKKKCVLPKIIKMLYCKMFWFMDVSRCTWHFYSCDKKILFSIKYEGKNLNVMKTILKFIGSCECLG